MGASVTIRRRLQWIDTDAAGIWHHSTALRWAEEAEAELHRDLGIVQDTFGHTPRVRVEFDFGVALGFDDEVEICLTVGRIGKTSLEYEVSVDRGEENVATGRMVVVLIDREAKRPVAWPDHIRSALASPI